MRFAVMSDVQANLAALRAVLDEISRRGDIDRVFAAGDLVGLGPHPNEVIELLREESTGCVKGNYDDAIAFQRISSGVDFADEAAERVDQAAVAWTRRAMSPESVDFLRKLPYDLRILETGGVVKIKANEEDANLQEFKRHFLTRVFVGSLAERKARIQPRRVLVVHGSPRALNEFIRPDTARSILQTIAEGSRADVVISGHAGVSFFRQDAQTAFVGVGSTSGPRTPPGEAEFVVVDLEEEVLTEFVRVSYDPTAHLNAIMTQGLPPALAARFDLTSL